MKRIGLNRRTLIVAATAALLSGCAVVPKGGQRPVPPPPAPEPTETGLPTDSTHHRVALLVPMTGDNAAVGQSIANATTMALLDTNAANLRITTYDTAKGAQTAARQAIADGNRLILGPLLGSNVASIVDDARKAKVPLITFSNDTTVAAADVFVMGHVPEQSIANTVRYARKVGARDFAILSPDGDYGKRAEAALQAAIANYGGRIVSTEHYARNNTSIVSAAQRLKARGGFDTVLIAESATLATRAGAVINPAGKATQRILGTELWSGESILTKSPGMRGALFSAVSDARYKRFVDSYLVRFGGQPHRIATLGYDAVLLTLRIARDWKVGTTFPVAQLRSAEGFKGLDGAIRFLPSGVAERAMDVREVKAGEIVVAEPAPATFQ